MGKNRILSVYLSEEAFFRLRSLGILDQYARAKKRGYISNMVCNLIINHVGESKDKVNLLEEQTLISKINNMSKVMQKYNLDLEELKQKLSEVKKRNGTYIWEDKK